MSLSNLLKITPRPVRRTGSTQSSETEFAKAAKSPFVSPMNSALATEIRRLTPVEKLQLVEALWDDLATDKNPLPIPDWHRQELAEDQGRYQANPTEGSPWPEVKARVTRAS